MSEGNSDDLFGQRQENRGSGDEFLVVGIGASAGGIHALKQFFEQVPSDSGMAYVVILHLSPDHESRLAELLQTSTALPVSQVNDRVKVEPNHVYVISPNQSLSMVDGYLDFTEMIGFEERRAPVDIFFRTLAESHHSRAVCVVLSGTGANGSMGMKRVKENGGICIVQDPNEAEFSDMPRNAIATGLVDNILPVAEIPAKIIAYKKHIGSVSIPAEPREIQQADEQALRDVFTQLRLRTGHDFSNYKRSTVLRRIERRISVHEVENLSAYAEYLRAQPDEARALLKDLLISVTNFFRDPEAFSVMEREIIPRLFEHKGPDDHVRVWVAGCATGEEAYSMAILLSEFVGNAVDAPTIQVFATDIDEWAISKARDGSYTINDAADVSPERLRKFFVKEGEGYRVGREIREMVLFAQHNVIKDPPFSHLDLVTCRNLLIYLNRSAQTRVMEIFHFALNPGGFLFLGTSESIEGAGDLFVAVDQDERIFQSRVIEHRKNLPVPNMSLTDTSAQFRTADVLPDIRVRDRLSFLDLHLRLLEELAPPSVLVNEEYDIVHLSERAGRYMQVGGGEFSNNLLKLIRPALRLELRTALYQATQRRAEVELQDVPVDVDGVPESVDIVVRPILRRNDTARGFNLILFRKRDEIHLERQPATIVNTGEPLAQQLEEELLKVRSQLRATSEQHELQEEELKASNEELQAMNEELRSAAEELETSKEELQSVNEELTTVNQELKVKIEEISQASSDLNNLINSTGIGTIFLDRSHRVKLFTPRARDIFNFIPSDTGRRLSDITSALVDIDLMSDVERVLEQLITIEREVSTTKGQVFLFRILPYRTLDDRINGVVLTFMDVTENKHAQEERNKAVARFRRATQIETVGIVFFSADGEITDCNDAFLLMSGYTRPELTEPAVKLQVLPSREALDQFKTEGRITPFERQMTRRDRSTWWALFSATELDEGTGVEFVIDITKSKEIAAQLAEALELTEHSVQQRTSALANANSALADADTARTRILKQLVTAQEDERSRVARDLHDQLGQQLTALRLQLEIIKGRVVEDAKAYEQIEQAQVIARRIETEIDFLAWELRPLALDDLGLPEALNDYVQRWSRHTQIPVDFHTSGLEERLAPEIETNLYRIAQEALNNIHKHAGAESADLLLERRDHSVVLIVEDNGSGFDSTAKLPDGLGLISMRERAAVLNGTIEVESAPGKGTTIFARIPIPHS